MRNRKNTNFDQVTTKFTKIKKIQSALTFRMILKNNIRARESLKINIKPLLFEIKNIIRRLNDKSIGDLLKNSTVVIIIYYLLLIAKIDLLKNSTVVIIIYSFIYC